MMSKLRQLEVDITDGKVYNSEGKEIGFSDKSQGYIKIGLYRNVAGKKQWKYIKRSHIIWWAATGEWPTRLVDHENRVKSDDRFSNLRYLTTQQNALNTTPSDIPKGIYFDPGTNKTRPYKVMTFNKGPRFIGRYETMAEAIVVAKQVQVERSLVIFTDETMEE